jgi:hypothetical protein
MKITRLSTEKRPGEIQAGAMNIWTDNTVSRSRQRTVIRLKKGSYTKYRNGADTSLLDKELCIPEESCGLSVLCPLVERKYPLQGQLHMATHQI